MWTSRYSVARPAIPRAVSLPCAYPAAPPWHASRSMTTPGSSASTAPRVAYIKVNERAKGVEGLQSPIVKFIPEDNLNVILDRVGAVDGDIVFFGADKARIVSEALGALRIKLGHDLDLLTCEWAPLWVVDFPMFEENDD